MDLNEAIHSRRSVRAYKDEPLTRETVDKLIRAAVQALSARQPPTLGFCGHSGQ